MFLVVVERGVSCLPDFFKNFSDRIRMKRSFFGCDLILTLQRSNLRTRLFFDGQRA